MRWKVGEREKKISLPVETQEGAAAAITTGAMKGKQRKEEKNISIFIRIQRLKCAIAHFYFCKSTVLPTSGYNEWLQDCWSSPSLIRPLIPTQATLERSQGSSRLELIYHWLAYHWFASLRSFCFIISGWDISDGAKPQWQGTWLRNIFISSSNKRYDASALSRLPEEDFISFFWIPRGPVNRKLP